MITVCLNNQVYFFAMGATPLARTTFEAVHMWLPSGQRTVGWGGWDREASGRVAAGSGAVAGRAGVGSGGETARQI